MNFCFKVEINLYAVLFLDNHTELDALRIAHHVATSDTTTTILLDPLPQGSIVSSADAGSVACSIGTFNNVMCKLTLDDQLPPQKPTKWNSNILFVLCWTSAHGVTLSTIDAVALRPSHYSTQLLN